MVEYITLSFFTFILLACAVLIWLVVQIEKNQKEISGMNEKYAKLHNEVDRAD